MNTPNDKETAEFAENAKVLFDDSVGQLDAATLSKLNRGRQAALEQLADTSPSRQWLRWAPLTGAAAAAAVAVVVLRGPLGPDSVELPADLTDLEILISEDSLEMIEELEFYSWIDMVELDDADNVS